MAFKRSRSFSFAPRKRFRKSGRFNIKRRRSRPLAPRRTGGFYSVRARTLGAEKKTIDMFPNAAGVLSAQEISNTSTDAWLLNAVATGSDFTQRIGRRIKMKSWFFRCWFSLKTTNTTITNSSSNRLLVVYDKQYNATVSGTTATVPTVAGQTSLVLQNNSTVSPINLNNRDRYKVLLDKTIPLDMSQIGKHITIYKRLNLDVTFGNTGATGGDIQTGAILMFMVGSAAPALNTTPIASWYSRIRFVDM